MWTTPGGFIFKSLCKEMFTKCLRSVNTIPRFNVSRICICHLSKRKGNLWGQPASGTPAHHCRTGLRLSLTCRQPTDVRLGQSTSCLPSSNKRGSDYPEWPSLWWTFDAGGTLELLKTYMKLKSHLPINWDFNHYFLYAFVFICLWSLIFMMSHFYPHWRPFSSMCWKCDWYHCHSPALPDCTEICLSSKSWSGKDTQQEDQEKCASKGHFCLRRALLEVMFPCYTCACSHPSPSPPRGIWLEVYFV